MYDDQHSNDQQSDDQRSDDRHGDDQRSDDQRSDDRHRRDGPADDDRRDVPERGAAQPWAGPPTPADPLRPVSLPFERWALGRRDAETLAGQWMDDPTDVPLADLGPVVDRQRLADLQFLHGLLEQMHSPPAATEMRVQRVLASLDDYPPTRASSGWSPRRIVWRLVRPRWVVPVLVAAATLVIVVVSLRQDSSQMAHAAVARIAAEASLPVDRQYLVVTRLANSDGDVADIKSTLYVRGNAKYVLRHPTILGPVWFGHNGVHGWIVPAVGLPLDIDEEDGILRWARREGVWLPDLRLTTILSRMARDFDLQLLPSEPLSIDPLVQFQHVRGIRRPAAERVRARTVDLWADPDLGVAARVEMTWQTDPQPGLVSIYLDLVSQDPLPDDWYEASGHLTSRDGK